MKDSTTILGDEAAVLPRLIQPGKNFDEQNRARMHELAQKNQAAALTPKEEKELQSYLKVGLFLDILHAKANFSLHRR